MALSKMPGLGKIGFADFDPATPEAEAHARWTEKADIAAYHCFSDPEFVRAFTASIEDADEQDKYIEQTLRSLDRKGEADPEYVLMFRRSIPSKDPKPEGHWTSDYMTALRGLRKEIAGAQRLHSVILCSTLADVLASGPVGNNAATSDGELKVDNTAFDQAQCLCSFRPADQQRELDAYMQQVDALPLEHIADELRAKFAKALDSTEHA